MHDTTTSTSAEKSATRRFSFDQIAVWALAVSAALAILIVIPHPIIPALHTKVTVLMLGVIAALVLYLLARLTRGNVIVPPLPLVGALWLVPLAYALSTLFSGVRLDRAFYGYGFETDTLGFVVLLAALATLAALAVRRLPHYRAVFSALGVAFGLILVSEVAFLILARLAPGTVTATMNLAGSFADLGMLTGLGVALSLLALRFLTLSGPVSLALRIALALGLAILALANLSYIWLLIALISLGLFIEGIMRRRMPSADDDLEGVTTVAAEAPEAAEGTARPVLAPLAALALSLFFLIGGGTLGNAIVSTFGTNVIDARPSWIATFDVGSHVYASSPLFGSGPGTFGEEWLRFRDRGVNDTVFWNVDFSTGIGYLPTAFVTTGLAGALAWTAFLLLFLILGLRALLLRLPREPFMRFTAIASFVGAWYVLALSVIAVPGPVVLATGFLLAGVFISALRHAPEKREWGIIFSRTPRIGFIIVFLATLLLLASVAAAYVVVGRYLSTISYLAGAQELSAGDAAGATAAARQSLLFGETDRARQLAAQAGIAEMNRIASDTALSPSTAQQQFQTALSNALADATAATELGPDDYRNWAVLGSVYQTVVPLNIEGAYENARTAYGRSVEQNPQNPALRYVLAQLEIAHNDLPAAEAELERAIELRPSYTEAIFLLSQLRVGQGRAREALEAAEAAAYFAPNDAVVLFQVGILRSSVGDTQGAIVALARAAELNPAYANARFYLSVMYALSGNLDAALAELRSVAGLSAENAAAVADDIAALEAGENPFPPSRLGALGIPQAVEEPQPEL